MKRLAVCLVIVCVPAARSAEPSAAQVDFFEKKVRPVLVQHCYKCHSSQAKKLKAGLNVDSRAGLLEGGEGGPALMPGKPSDSLLIQAVRHDSVKMPPDRKLPAADIEALTEWVAMGAPWPGAQAARRPLAVTNWDALRQKHWSWQPVRPHTPPAVKNAGWLRNPIDHFVLSRLEAETMSPAPSADRRTLIRRASFDLLGLPPTPAEVAAFVDDPSPTAYELLIDRLLASPHYGERWARHWLDIARYNDGFGNGFDGADKPQAFRYRDWVVQAFNRDLPFDQFLKQQIAGDLLGGADTAVATGFLALGPLYKSDGGDPDSVAKAKAETLDDRIDTISRGLFALTVACARCHDHKYDPIPTLDYYSLVGIFESTREVDRPLTADEAARRYEAAQQAIRDAEEKLEKLKLQARNAPQGLSAAERKEQEELRAELPKLKKALPPMPPTAHVLADGKGKDVAVALRGDLLRPGPMAPRRFLSIVAGDNAPRFTQGSGRLQLAEAIADPRNPLTTRAFVNRVWMHHFGKALVRTPDNFGSQGEVPSHPELLDWLADSFLKSGGSIKHLHRTIMLSASYQMSSAHDPRYFEKDGDNRWLWRMNPRRLDAEALRDSWLSVTGELERTLGGPPEQQFLESTRRSLYQKISRNGDRFESDRFLRLWDFPIPRASCIERSVSTTPQQYLFLMNSPFVLARSKALAERLTRAADNEAGRIEFAYQLLYARSPTAEEKQFGAALLAKDGEGRRAYAQLLLGSDEFMYIR